MGNGEVVDSHGRVIGNFSAFHIASVVKKMGGARFLSR